MKLGLTENQYNRLLNLILEQAEPPASEPEAGTSSKQAGGQGYPAVGKWESGVTRGPGNQIGITKWADVVGAKLNRGKANPLKEIEYTKKSLLRLINEQNKSVKGTTTSSDPWAAESSNNKPGTTEYTTYWGEKYQIPNQGYVVDLWTPSTNRLGDMGFPRNQNGKWEFTQKIDPLELDYIKKLPKDRVQNYLITRRIDLKRNIRTYEMDPPTEGYLRKLFPDGTIKSITDLSTEERYNCHLTPIDLNDSENYNKKIEKDTSIMGGIINVQKNKFIQWVPQYGYWFSPVVGKTGEALGESKVFRKKIIYDTDYDEFTKTKYNPEQDYQRLMNRISYSGKSVPKGMNPNTYDDYLYRKSLLNKWNEWKEKTPRPIYYQYFTRNEWIDIHKMFNVKDKNGNDTDKEDQILNLQDLDNHYISPLGEGGVPEFSYGIDGTKSRRKYFQFKEAIDAEYDSRIKYLQQKTEEMTHNSSVLSANGRMGVPTKKYDQGYDNLKKELDTLVKEKAEKLNVLRMTWGYDYWKPSFMGKAFDEAWDKWGTAIQLGVNFIMLLGTGGLANLAFGEVSLLFKAIVNVGVDVAFNSLIAVYQYDRGETDEAALSLLCALLPAMKFTFNIGKINAEASLELARKIKLVCIFNEMR